MFKLLAFASENRRFVKQTNNTNEDRHSTLQLPVAVITQLPCCLKVMCVLSFNNLYLICSLVCLRKDDNVPVMVSAAAAFGECLMCIFHSLLACSQVMGPTSSPQASSEGLCFSDGRRKVDYVLVFHHRRHSSIRASAGGSLTRGQVSVVSNGNFPQTASPEAVAEAGGARIQRGEAASVGEVFMELRSAKGSETMEPADHEMQLIRQEFEANLVEAGLEIERESEVGVKININTIFILSY